MISSHLWARRPSRARTGRSKPSGPRELGYQADDRKSVGQALDKLAPLRIRVIVPMHGPTLTAHTDDMLRAFRDNALATA